MIPLTSTAYIYDLMMKNTGGNVNNFGLSYVSLYIAREDRETWRTTASKDHFNNST